MHRIAVGFAIDCAISRQPCVQEFRSIAFIGEPWPMNRAGRVRCIVASVMLTESVSPNWRRALLYRCAGTFVQATGCSNPMQATATPENEGHAAGSAGPGRVAVVGGGPAGLMAAEAARAGGADVHVYERLGSVGRKFLVAGKGGLNLTHSEGTDAFVQRYGARRHQVARWIAQFDPAAIRDWARALGVETFVGSSGRVFPRDLKAAPLLRGWVRRLRASGVAFHVQHRWLGWGEDGALRFAHADGERRVS